MSVKLDIGCGDHLQEGFVGIDRKLGVEAYPLTQYADNSVDEIYASHILEHFSFADAPKVLAEWFRVLRPNTRIRISVPDLREVSRAYLQTGDPLCAKFLIGGQVDESDFHRSVWDESLLLDAMRSAGFRNLTRWSASNGDCAGYPISLNIEARKPPAEIKLPPHDMIMSVPRLVFSDNSWCACAVASKTNPLVRRVVGVYWDQCVERMMTESVASGVEFILTADYDTVFMVEHVTELFRLMLEHPEIDALAAIQVKRSDGSWMIKPVNESDIDNCEVAECTKAHFGLTLFRAARLKDIPHPWFWAQPAPNGTWGDGRVEADIYFWKHFREHGRRLFAASRVSIGHQVLVTAWPSRNGVIYAPADRAGEIMIPEGTWR